MRLTKKALARILRESVAAAFQEAAVAIGGIANDGIGLFSEKNGVML
jgi:hypothetical protein